VTSRWGICRMRHRARDVGSSWLTSERGLTCTNKFSNLFYVREIGFQSVESKPFPLPKNHPPAHDLPRRGDFSQPGVAASAATPGTGPQTPLRPQRGCFRFGDRSTVVFERLFPTMNAILTGQKGCCWRPDLGETRARQPQAEGRVPVGEFSRSVNM
jgi:hypothetical protein